MPRTGDLISGMEPSLSGKRTAPPGGTTLYGGGLTSLLGPTGDEPMDQKWRPWLVFQDVKIEIQKVDGLDHYLFQTGCVTILEHSLEALMKEIEKEIDKRLRSQIRARKEKEAEEALRQMQTEEEFKKHREMVKQGMAEMGREDENQGDTPG